jgi:sugar phosphate isomerase/epimerase
MTNEFDRRTLLQGSLAAGVIAGTATAQTPKKAKEMTLKHSIASWCFSGNGEKWSLPKMCEVAKEIGCESIELLDPSSFPTLEKAGLVCALAGNTMPGGFRVGFNNPKFHEELIKRTTDVIDACACSKFPAVIGFIGFKYTTPEDVKSPVISRADAIANSVAALRKLAPIAEKRGVTICIEHLNSRDGSHPMKGHPGYQGDDLDLVCDVLRQVNSPFVKLLFDVYHVQIMHGDLVKRLDECKDVIGHIHTAGNPGRNELDATQEINYKAIGHKLRQLKYARYVGHEFIPTRDPKAGLVEAIAALEV